MEDTFLKEQLQLIRRLSAQISEAHDRLGGQSANPGDDAPHGGPLQVKDFRPLQTQDYRTADDDRHPSVELNRKPHSVHPRRRRRG